MTAPVIEKSGWDELWNKKLHQYLDTVPRTGIFVGHLFPKARTFLELGAGSARDSYYLNQVGYHSTGSDYSDAAFDAWRDVYGDNFPIKLVDAFKIDAADDAYDVTFHNGLYVLFDDEPIKQLIREQARITRSAMVIIVHNKRNTRLESKFKTLAKTDALYRIRFFDPHEMVRLVKESGVAYSSVKVRKFGGPADRTYAWSGATARKPSLCKRLGGLTSFAYQLQPWSLVERSAIVVHFG